MDRKYPTFSIVTPSLNQGKYLEATIYSVISQEGDFYINYMLIDGGSTDSSLDIVKNYESRIRSGSDIVKCRGVKFFWMSGKDNGQYDAINRGFSLSNGEIMGWINSDDVYLPSAFKAITMVFREFPEVSWITANSTRIDKEGMIIDVDTSSLYPRILISRGVFNGRDGRFIQQESTFWKRSLWDQLESKLNNTWRYAADFELWMRFAALTDLVKVQTQLGAFRKHDGQKTTTLTNYNREVDSIKKVRLFDRLVIRLIRLLSKMPLLNRISLLHHHAFTVYYSDMANGWIMEKGKGKVT